MSDFCFSNEDRQELLSILRVINPLTQNAYGPLLDSWGMLARISVEGKALKSATFQFVRHNESNETVPCTLKNESSTLEDIAQRGAAFGARLRPVGDQVSIELQN